MNKNDNILRQLTQVCPMLRTNFNNWIIKYSVVSKTFSQTYNLYNNDYSKVIVF